MIICVHCHKSISASAGRDLFDGSRIFPGPKVHAKTCYPMAQAALHLSYLKLFDKSAERSERKSFSAS
jgi:hypothetical protein